MTFHLIKNDCLRNKITTLLITMFVAAAALLISLAAILAVNLTGAIQTLMTQAKTPHFMQMHSGEFDTWELDHFVKDHPAVEEFQVLEFLNIDNSKILLGKNSLSHSTQDNGFSTQSETFDYLLDLDGNIIDVPDGALYVPICYMQSNTVKIGDKAYIGGKEFIVAGFLRDSQMNSMLSSSKRFLVSENDYLTLKDLGKVEYLVEFRLKDLAALSAFEADYASAKLPGNGPTVTYPLFKMLNGISDGMMIGVILLISLLVVMISLLCIRFTLLAKIQDEIREIGVLKAIGLRVSDLKQIYLAKYAAMGLTGCISGFALSFLFRGILTRNIRLTMGESKQAPIAGLVGILGVLLVFLAILFFVNGILRRFRKISAAEAMRFGIIQEKPGTGKTFFLYRNRLFNANVFLGIKDVLSRKGLYATSFISLVAAGFIMIVPLNLYSTISADSFATYMGIGNCDLRIDIQQTDQIGKKAAEIEHKMKRDNNISKYTVFTTKAFSLKLADGSVKSMKIELGDHSVFPVSYALGKAPAASDEIALSAINAEDLDKKVGDIMTLMTDKGEKNLKVCGIYSDITNGGKTAKAVFTDPSAEVMWSIIYGSLMNRSTVYKTVDEYGKEYDYAKMTNIQEYISQTYGQTLVSVKQASIAAIAVSLVITVLVMLLFMKLLTAKDRYSIAVMKAWGFTNSDIRIQYITRSIFILIPGIAIGTLLANTMGESIAGMVISSFGASSFKFAADPLLSYILCPFLMVCSVLTATILGTWSAGNIKITENIKE